MINVTGKSIPCTFSDFEYRVQEKLELERKLYKEMGKWVGETIDLWLVKQLSLFFSDDFDLFWAYDSFKFNKDWESIRKMMDDHDLRITKQSGKVALGSDITYLFHGPKLLGTLEIKLDENFCWKVKYS